MLKVRVSQIEGFRRVLREEYADEAELLANVRWWNGLGDEPPGNWQMAAGTAWHKCLDADEEVATFGHPADGGFYEYGEYVFRGRDVVDAINHQGTGLREVTARKVFHTPHGPVLLQGTCDHIHGLAIRDAKCRFSTPAVADYEPSLQWRLYVLLFHATSFTYDLFAMREPDDAGLVVVRETLSCRFWRYAALEADCQRWLLSFADWAEARGLFAPTREVSRV